MKNAVLASLAAAVLAAVPAGARAEDAGGTPSAARPVAADGQIAWAKSLSDAFAEGAKEGKPIFIAINAERVDGGRYEPAAKELRENTYKDAAVVAKSRSFACALLRSDGSSADFGELRQRFAIEGVLVSPQHLFAHSDGRTLIEREEYWPHGTGQNSVNALLAMMERAVKAAELRRAAGAATPPAPAPTPGGPDAAPGGGAPAPGSAEAQRADWIRKMLEVVRGSDKAARDAAVAELVKADQKGDCVEPLCVAMLEASKDPEAQSTILRALGKPGLEIVVPSVVQLLDAKDDLVRSNAAVTLEYVGSARAVEGLLKRLPREREGAVFNNACRALGRCGAKQEPVRKALLKELAGAKSNLVFAGPATGLAYFEKDAEAARAVEKVAKKDGERFRRGYCEWLLTEIGDPKSAEFVRKELLPQENFPLVVTWVKNVIAAILGGEGAAEAKRAVDAGMDFVVGQEDESIGGPARQGRDQSEFKPKGEFTPRKWGGRGGGGGGPGMGG